MPNTDPRPTTTPRQCSRPECSLPARRGWTTCTRHYTGGRGLETPAQAKRRPPKPAHNRVCKECEIEFVAHRFDKCFCNAKCRSAWNNRRTDRGANIYDAAMKWRKERHKDDFTAMCQVIDMYLREDKDRDRTTYNRRPPELER